MPDNTMTAMIAFFICAAVAGIVVAVAMASVTSNENWYESQAKMQSACVSSGGSWIPLNTYNQLCVHGTVENHH